jgi:ribosomal protein S12 methylthiotransferase accessory factor
MIVDPRQDAPVASYCASAAHAVAASAVMGALVEVCTSIGVYQKPFAAEKSKARALYEDASLVQEMRDHVLLYSLPEALERLHFLNPSAPAGKAEEVFADQEKPWRSLSLTEDLTQLMTATCAVADDVLVVDQTGSILQPLGLHCAKVLTPGLMPVTFGHQYRRIHPLRLQMAQEYLQKKGEPNEPGLNPFPHNFP